MTRVCTINVYNFVIKAMHIYCAEHDLTHWWFYNMVYWLSFSQAHVSHGMTHRNASIQSWSACQILFGLLSKNYCISGGYVVNDDTITIPGEVMDHGEMMVAYFDALVVNGMYIVYSYLCRVWKCRALNNTSFIQMSPGPVCSEQDTLKYGVTDVQTEPSHPNQLTSMVLFCLRSMQLMIRRMLGVQNPLPWKLHP